VRAVLGWLLAALLGQEQEGKGMGLRERWAESEVLSLFYFSISKLVYKGDLISLEY
jgi:hypothetical protein